MWQVEVSHRGFKAYFERTAYEKLFVYKEKNKRIKRCKIKKRVFNVGDVSPLQLLDKDFLGQIEIPVGLDHFTIVQVFPYGTVGYLKLLGWGPNLSELVNRINTLTLERDTNRGPGVPDCGRLFLLVVSHEVSHLSFSLGIQNGKLRTSGDKQSQTTKPDSEWKRRESKPIKPEGVDQASPPDSELVSLEVVEIVISEVGGIDTDILLTIKDNILHEKLLNVNLLIAKIEALKDNPTPSSDFVTKSSSTSLKLVVAAPLLIWIIFLFQIMELLLRENPDSGNFTTDVVEDIFDNPTREPRVHVLNVLPTHPTLQLDSDFALFSDSLRSDLVVSFPFGTRNKIFDPGIFIEVQSKRFLSISFIRDLLSPVVDTLLLFSSENEEKTFFKSWIARILKTRAHGFVLRSLKLHNLSFILGIQYPNLID
ncbi:hypothetical protein Tco_0524119 [Tanacetum coccineum]